MVELRVEQNMFTGYKTIFFSLEYEEVEFYNSRVLETIYGKTKRTMGQCRHKSPAWQSVD